MIHAVQALCCGDRGLLVLTHAFNYLHSLTTFSICFTTERCKGNQFAQDASVSALLLIQNKNREHLDIPKALNRFVYISYYKSLCVSDYQLDFSCTQVY